MCINDKKYYTVIEDMSFATPSSYSSSQASDGDPSKTAQCIRNVANFSHVRPFHLIDKKAFNPRMLDMAIPDASPKLDALFDKIAKLDAQDMRRDGKHYKHMIFTDMKSSTYGAKLLASAFYARGFTPAYETHGVGFHLKDDEALSKTKGNNFAVLVSKTFHDRSMSVRFKKALLERYNARPDNVQGELMRFVILDQGFKEGIDLFDIKYVHLFEPLVVHADEKQAIGRGTRFCGQKGLTFHPKYGWPLYVFRYDVKVPQGYGAKTMGDMFLEYSNIDLRRVAFAADLESVAIEAAVDHALTAPVHQFKVERPPAALAHGGAPVFAPTPISSVPRPPRQQMTYASMSTYIRKHFMKFKYPEVRLKNNCVGGGDAMDGGAPTIVSFTPTQDFVRHYFQPSSAYKGLLLFQSVGTGKTCSAIATATTSFEKEGYNILWVTRHTLKSDIWKNMFSQVCSLVVQEQLKKGEITLPDRISSPMKYVSDKWIEPISYKQFSNMLLKKNKFYDEVVKRNGTRDPLRKTLIIIDEAHKLYSPNVVGSEKPQTEILEEMIQNSYKVSGRDSCRVLLMTATPYTEDGMEMIKLLNLLRPAKEHMPTDFDEFSSKYLNKNGYFTKEGTHKFRNDIAGYISYLNRSQDARNFAHPVLEDVFVPMSRTPDEDALKPTKEQDEYIKELTQQLKDMRQAVREEKTGVTRELKAAKSDAKAQAQQYLAECKEKAAQTYQRGVEKAKERKESAMEDCKERPRNQRKACKDEATAVFKRASEELKASKKSAEESCKEEKQSRFESAVERASKNATKMQGKMQEMKEIEEKRKAARDAIKEITSQLKDMTSEAKEIRTEVKELRTKRKDLATKLKAERQRIKKIEDKDERRKATKALQQSLGAEFKAVTKEYFTERAKVVQITNDKKLMRYDIGRTTLGDLSQETALTKRCKL